MEDLLQQPTEVLQLTQIVNIDDCVTLVAQRAVLRHRTDRRTLLRVYITFINDPAVGM